jgi:hypothetical protein
VAGVVVFLSPYLGLQVHAIFLQRGTNIRSQLLVVVHPQVVGVLQHEQHRSLEPLGGQDNGDRLAIVLESGAIGDDGKLKPFEELLELGGHHLQRVVQVLTDRGGRAHWNAKVLQGTGGPAHERRRGEKPPRRGGSHPLRHNQGMGVFAQPALAHAPHFTRLCRFFPRLCILCGLGKRKLGCQFGRCLSISMPKQNAVV